MVAPEIVSGSLTLGPLTTGGITLIGALSIIHGINYQFSYNFWIRYALGTGYFVLGVLTMVYPSRMIQLGTIAAIIFIFILERFTATVELYDGMIKYLSR